MLSFLPRPDFLFSLSFDSITWVATIISETTMNPAFVANAFWISFTVNISSLLFFVSRQVISGITKRFCDRPNDWRRALYVLHDNKKWYIPRFLVNCIQSVLLSFLGVILLCQRDVISKPFYGLGEQAQTYFALNIGCYLYRIFQDVILQRDLNKVGVDIVHHVVTVIVYSVFLFYEQNVLFGALGMLFTITSPCIEIRRLIKVAEMQEQSKRFYKINLLVCSVLTCIARLIVPSAFIVWSLVQGSPLTMDVVVVAVYFLSVIFFGALNIWLTIASFTSIYKCWHSHRTDKLTRVLNAGEPHGLEIQASDRRKFTTKRNDINYMMPCSNANIAPQLDLPSNAQRCNLVHKPYHKTNVTEFLSNPHSSIPGHSFNNRYGRRRSEGSHDSSSSDVLLPGALETNVNVQINEFEGSSLSGDDSNSRVSFPFPTVSNLARTSRDSSSTTSDPETRNGSNSRVSFPFPTISNLTRSRDSPSTTSDVETRSDSNGHVSFPFPTASNLTRSRDSSSTTSDTETLNDSLFNEIQRNNSIAESSELFMDIKLPKSGEPRFVSSLISRPNRVPLSRSFSGGALDRNSNFLYEMETMNGHIPNSSHIAAISDIGYANEVLHNGSINQPPPSSIYSDLTDRVRDIPRTFNSA